MVKMKYSLYKPYYNQFPASDYDKKTKSIMVDIPKYKKLPFPKDWVKSKNPLICGLETPSKCIIYSWNRGYSENFEVTLELPYCRGLSCLINPGINARQEVIDTVAEFEAEKKKWLEKYFHTWSEEEIKKLIWDFGEEYFKVFI